MNSHDSTGGPSGAPESDENDWPPAWDQEEADRLIGKYALVGVTWLRPDGVTVTKQDQYHGRIVAADQDTGIRIDGEGAFAGETRHFPPDPTAFVPADPGEYELRSTGEVVKDPDVLATWTVQDPLDS